MMTEAHEKVNDWLQDSYPIHEQIEGGDTYFGLWKRKNEDCYDMVRVFKTSNGKLALSHDYAYKTAEDLLKILFEKWRDAKQ